MTCSNPKCVNGRVACEYERVEIEEHHLCDARDDECPGWNRPDHEGGGDCTVPCDCAEREPEQCEDFVPADGHCHPDVEKYKEEKDD